MTGANDVVYDNPFFQISVPAPRHFHDELKIVSTKEPTEAYKVFPKSGLKFSGEKNSLFSIKAIRILPVQRPLAPHLWDGLGAGD